MTPLRYNPDSEDFSQILGELGAHLEDARDVYGDGAVAVYLIAFDESIDILGPGVEGSGPGISQMVRQRSVGGP